MEAGVSFSAPLSVLWMRLSVSLAQADGFGVSLQQSVLLKFHLFTNSLCQTCEFAARVSKRGLFVTSAFCDLMQCTEKMHFYL